jgi:hypothetical protein
VVTKQLLKNNKMTDERPRLTEINDKAKGLVGTVLSKGTYDVGITMKVLSKKEIKDVRHKSVQLIKEAGVHQYYSERAWLSDTLSEPVDVTWFEHLGRFPIEDYWGNEWEVFVNSNKPKIVVTGGIYEATIGKYKDNEVGLVYHCTSMPLDKTDLHSMDTWREILKIQTPVPQA